MFHLRFYLLHPPLSVHDQLRHAAIHHSTFFSSNVSTHPCSFFC